MVTTSMTDKYLEDVDVLSDRYQEETELIQQYGLLNGSQEAFDEICRCDDLAYKT
jgi:hypothetical protein